MTTTTRVGRFLGMCAMALGCWCAAPIRASAAQDAAAALAKDATCTTCHNASTGHATAIYESRHGNKADSRTPSCQSCHGPSDAHVSDPANVPPTVVFGAKSKHLSPAADRNASCLTCHAKNVLPRTNWTGSMHESQGLACTNCHNIHAAEQKVLSKATQAEVCFTCHKTQRAQIRHLSSHPLARHQSGSPPKMVVLGLSRPSWVDRTETARQEHGERNLLHLPRRKARAVPLGAHARRRRLHQLPRTARVRPTRPA